MDQSDSEFDIPDLQETLLEDVIDEFATFGGSDPLDKSANDDFDEINTMTDSRWRLFLEDTDPNPDPMDVDPNNTTFHSCASQDDGSSSFFSARSGISTDNDEEVTIRVQRGLSNDQEDPKLAEKLDSMIHQRRKFMQKGMPFHWYCSNHSTPCLAAKTTFDVPFPMFKNWKGMFYRLRRLVTTTYVIEFPTPILVSSFLLVAHYHHTSSSLSKRHWTSSNGPCLLPVPQNLDRAPETQKAMCTVSKAAS